MLAASGCSTTVVLLCKREELRDAALRNLRKLGGLPVLDWPATTARTPLRGDVVVDGLLGTGLQGEVREPVADAIRFINQQPAPVVAIDVPSGLGTATCVHAAVTVTMGLPKVDLLRFPDHAGELVVADIGLARDVTTDVELITAGDVKPLFPPRSRSAHKGNFGHLLIVAGSEGYTGAPVLCAAAAARSGAGLVTLAVPPAIYPIVAAQCPPEVMPRPLENLDYEKYDAIAVGPGIGRDVPWLFPLITGSRKPLVLDADALNALAGNLGVLKGVRAVLTPHPGEMARLTGQKVVDRWETARAFAKKYGVTLVLKGAGTVVTDPAGTLWINLTGNPGMAKGGMGDALTGIIGSFVAQGFNPLDASKAGVYLHGAAGDLARRQQGEISMQTTDLIAQLGPAFVSL